MAFLEAQNINKIFPAFDQGAEVVALKDVTLEVEEGGFTSLVGPSGCGKSTLLKIMSGLMGTSSGTITFNGNIVTSPPPGLIYLFQQYSLSLFPWRTVIQNVAFGPENGKKRESKRKLREDCEQFIHRVGLEGFESHYPWQLSGGMQQRVAIARALIFRPRVLLMDEPFSAVDAMTRVELQDMLLDLWKEYGLTIVFVTHDVDEAIYLSERVVAMKPTPGEIVEELAVPIEYPRDQLHTKESTEYLDLRHQLYKLVFSLKEQPVTGSVS